MNKIPNLLEALKPLESDIIEFKKSFEQTLNVLVSLRQKAKLMELSQENLDKLDSILSVLMKDE